jgi:hypothetical protein
MRQSLRCAYKNLNQECEEAHKHSITRRRNEILITLFLIMNDTHLSIHLSTIIYKVGSFRTTFQMENMSNAESSEGQQEPKELLN